VGLSDCCDGKTEFSVDALGGSVGLAGSFVVGSSGSSVGLSDCCDGKIEFSTGSFVVCSSGSFDGLFDISGGLGG
jgi:hypothetical protein